MKICFLTKTIFNLGGVQRVVSVLANELSKNHEISILCADDSYPIDRSLYNLDESIKVELDGKISHKNIVSKAIGKILKEVNSYTGILNNEMMKNILINAYYPKKTRNRLLENVNAHNYDVIIGVEGFYSILLATISNELNCKVIGWQHNSYDAYFKKKHMYYWQQDILFKEYLSNFYKYIVLTDLDKESMEKNFRIKCDRIYNPLSFKSIEKSKCDEKVILFVGRLHKKQKGIDLLIEAFNKIYKECDGWILKIVGDGPDKDEIAAMIKDLHLENRVILEPFTSDVKKYYLNSSIFVSSSRWEGFGLVITEAMECGLPVVAFGNSGPKEIINENGKNGFIVKCEDVDELADKIKLLINDVDLRKKIAQESMKRALDFSFEEISMQWNECIK